MGNTKHHIMLCFLLLLCFTNSSVSLSQPQEQQQEQERSILLSLTNSLSKAQFTTTHNLLKSTSTRSATRFHHHYPRRGKTRRNRQVSLPLSPGSDYTLSLTLNSHPPQSVSLYLDTGSDLVWFPCQPFECILCDGKSANSPTSSTNISKLTSKTNAVTCQSPACSAAHSNHPTPDLCAIANCPLDSIETSDCQSVSCPQFYYAYGDGSFLAKLYSDSMKIQSSLVLSNFTFGCSHSALAEPVGVAGFGRGLLSLPAQLAAFSPNLGNQFSYCLVSHSFDSDRIRRPSPLILGRYNHKQRKTNTNTNTNTYNGNQSDEFTYTSMLENPKHPYFYCVGLEGISVGKKYIPAPEFLKTVDSAGSGGMVVDSGTTFTMLPASLYNSVVAEFESRVGQVHERAKVVEENTGLGPCYYYDNNVVSGVPSLVFHFVGKGSGVAMPRRNYFYEFMDGGDGVRRERKVGCLMVMNGGDEKELIGGPGATLGNYQQQGFEVVYDLEKRRVGFARRQCASLWNSLNQG